VWFRNLKNEEAMARVGPQRHRGKKQIVGVMQHKQGQGSERVSVVDFTNLNEVQCNRWDKVRRCYEKKTRR